MKLHKFKIRRAIEIMFWMFFLLILIVPSTTNGSSSNNDSFTVLKRLQFDHESNIIIVGHTKQDDIYLSKLASNNGSKLWEKTFGGSATDGIIDLLIDQNNDIYIIGTTNSDDFPVKNEIQSTLAGSVDLFLTKWSSEGELLWSTYFGGSALESVSPLRQNVRLNSNNEIIFIGFTNSNDFPVSENAFQTEYGGGVEDVFVSKISSNGELIWSSYLGSSGHDWATMQFDSQENILIRGNAESGDISNSIKPGYEFSGGAQDPFLAKINQNGELLYTLYYGGSQEDYNFRFTVDNQDNIITLVGTYSDDYPVTINAFQDTKSDDGGTTDVSFAKFNTNGDVQWSTYFGGNNKDDIWDSGGGATVDDTGIETAPDIVVDSQNNVFFTTETHSTDLDDKFDEVFSNDVGAATNFVGKLSSNGELVFGRYIPGIRMDQHVTSDDGIIVTVTITNEDWEIQNGFQTNFAGSRDVAYAKLMANGTIEWSSYLGGSKFDQMVKTAYINDHLYVIGYTNSDDIPNAINSYSGGDDVFVCEIDPNGDTTWCKYFGTEEDDTTFGEGFLLDPSTGDFIVLVKTDFGTDGSYGGILSKTDSSGNDVWTQSIVPQLRITADDVDEEQLRNYIIALSIFSILVGGGFLLRAHRIKSNVKLAEMLMSETMSRILSPVFSNKPEMIYLFGMVKEPNKNNLPEGFVTDIPKEIMDFTYLLHPIRMSVIKLLSDSISLTTIQIRDVLELEWNDLNPHLKSMKKKKYITMEKEFIEGQLMTIVRPEPSTLKQYKMLKSLLMEFFDATPNIERYIKHVNDWQKSQDEPNLYPREKNGYH